MTEPVLNQESTECFGTVLRAWFAENEWQQILAENVARAKGNSKGPWGSQLSNAMQGKLEPKPPFFVSLAWFNEFIFWGDFTGITERKLLDRLENSLCLLNEDQSIFTAQDFFALYIGDKTDAFVTGEMDSLKSLVSSPNQSMTSQLLQELLEMHPSAVEGMSVKERYGFACGYLLANEYRITAKNSQITRDWADYWEDKQIPEDLLKAEAERELLT